MTSTQKRNDMPYDELPNNGWGDPPKYDWLSITVWAALFIGSLLFWAIVIYGIVKLVTGE